MAHLQDWTGVGAQEAKQGVAKQTIGGAGADLVRVTVPAGVSAPRHHHDHEQFVQVIQGEGMLETEQGAGRFGPGSIFHFPPGAWHAATFETETVLVETNLRA